MNAPTQKQIDAEIKALEECKSYIPKTTTFGDDNHRGVDLQIDFLKGEIDETADEWNDFNDDEQSIILEAKGWQEGSIAKSPSSGWDSYKPKTKKKK